MKQEKSQLKAGIILNYINLLLGNLIPVFYTPVMLRLLGQSEYGLFKLSSSVTSYLSLISMGIGSAVTRYLIKANTEDGKEQEERILGLFMLIFQVIAAAALLAGALLSTHLHLWYAASLTQAELHRMGILVFILACNTALSFQMTPYMSVVTAHEKFVFLQCANLVTTCVGPLINLLVLYLGYASVGMAISTLACGVVVRFVYFYYVRQRMGIKANYRRIPSSMLKEILTFSFWVFIANVVNQLYNATDTVMIGTVPALATTGVAVYNVGGVFNNIIFSLTTGISNLLSPKTNRMVFANASNQELTDLAIRVGRLQCLIITLVASGFIAFGQPFIRLYAGLGYEEAYWVAVLIMVPNIIPAVQSVCLNVIVAKNRHRFRSLTYLGIAILNVAGTWFLMHSNLGIIGAALATGIALIIGAGFVMNWYYWRKTGLGIGRFWKELSKLFIIPSIMCMTVLLSSNVIDYYCVPVMICGIILYTLVFCTLTWKLVMNNYEKNLVVGPLVRLRNKLHCNDG